MEKEYAEVLLANNAKFAVSLFWKKIFQSGT